MNSLKSRTHYRIATQRIVLAVACVIVLLAFGATAHAGPKNVIVMISDGCGYNHVDAASLYEYGRTGTQAYESFPVVLAMSTYAFGQGYDPRMAWDSFDYVSNGATDSAASGTALATGTKTYNGAIGVDVDRSTLTNAVEVAEAAGRATGVITSVQFAHATPAAFSVHHPSRNDYEQIARKMIYGSTLDVIMGCGHPLYNDSGREDSQGYQYVGGKKAWEDLSDGKAKGADADGDGQPDTWTVVFDREEFAALMAGPAPKRVLGIPKRNRTLQQKRKGDTKVGPFEVPFVENAPTLAEMTRAAINVLDEDPNGFFLMVEGGAVDWAGHSNQSGRVVEEEVAFNRAVDAVLRWVAVNSNWRDTLLIVTGDHETGYMTGPGSGTVNGEPVWNDVKSPGAGVQPEMQWHSGGHTNSLIPFYAKGRGANLFKRAADHKDPVRGRYIDNTDVGAIVKRLLR